MNRIERLAAILLLLQDRPRTSAQIAAHFELSRRTVLRDIQALSEMGVPIVAREGPGGGYSLPAGYSPEPLPLTGNEAFLLLLSLQSLSHLSDLPFREERATLLAKLKSLLPKSGFSKVESMLAAARIDIPLRQQQAPYLDALLGAVSERRWVKVVYCSSERTSTQHLLPQTIYAQDGLWYFQAYSFEREQQRTYRADRIQSLQAPDEGFTPPEQIPQPSAYSDAAHPLVEALLKPRAATRVEADRHLGSQMMYLPDGSARLAFRCPPSELEWFARYFAGLGEDVEVLAPEDLRQKIADLGQKLVEKYAKW